MFNSKQPEEKPTYLEIMGRYAAIKSNGFSFTSFVNKDWIANYQKASLTKAVNNKIADNTYAELISEVNSQQIKKKIINCLGVFFGRCVQSQEETEILLEGLASDAWLYGKQTKDIVAIYKKKPELVWLRIIELYG
ncbi:hypothetical protein CZP2022_256 [Vibrio phage C-ZP2022]|nr:hypothetical protein CZP2022_256 [Vibrio phage C-ZP2022]